LKTVRRSRSIVPRRQPRHPTIYWLGGAITACAAVGTNSRSVGWVSLGTTTLQPSRLRTRCPAVQSIDRDYRHAEFEDTEQGRSTRDLVGLAANGHPREPQLLVGSVLPPRLGRRSDIVLLFRQPPSSYITYTISERISGNKFGFACRSDFQRRRNGPNSVVRSKKYPSAEDHPHSVRWDRVGLTPGQSSGAQCQEPP
jgi:hypothetical protein